MKRHTAKRAGMAFTVLFFLCAIVCIILAGLLYQFTEPQFKNWAWNSLSALEVASIVYVFFVAILGFCAFGYPKRGLVIAFLVFCFLSILFTLAIAIFALIAGSTGYLNVFLGCNAPITGIMSIWRGMDAYLVNTDQVLCSPACPCYITNTVPYTSNPNVLPYFNQWSITNNAFSAVAFQNCTGAVHTAVYNAANAASPDFNPNGDFNQVNFWNYMANVENRFQCSGFCQNNYFNPRVNAQTYMVKYLFTNVNRGPPLYSGCLDQIINWLPSYLLAFGSVAMVLVGFEIFAFAMGCILASHKKKHHHDDVVVVEKKEVIREVPAVAYERRDVYVDRQ